MKLKDFPLEKINGFEGLPDYLAYKVPNAILREDTKDNWHAIQAGEQLFVEGDELKMGFSWLSFVWFHLRYYLGLAQYKPLKVTWEYIPYGYIPNDLELVKRFDEWLASHPISTTVLLPLETIMELPHVRMVEDRVSMALQPAMSIGVEQMQAAPPEVECRRYKGEWVIVGEYSISRYLQLQ